MSEIDVDCLNPEKILFFVDRDDRFQQLLKIMRKRRLLDFLA